MEKLSALMDGELDPHEAHRELGVLRTDAVSRERWDTYHLIGDALRGDALRFSRMEAAFSRRLADEPTVLAPKRRPVSRKVVAYALSAAASVSAVAMVAWVALTTNETGTAPQIAVRPQPAAVAVVEPAPALVSVPVQGEMNEYLLAHQGFSPSTAIQGVTPYIRSVSATQSASTR